MITILVGLVAVLIPWLPDPASEQMKRIEDVYWFATIICIGIFALVMSVLIYCVMTFRAAPEDESDGPSIHGHTGLEIVWTVVPAILVIAIGVVSAVVLSQNGDKGNDPMTVRVFAQQFSWRFEYPDSKGVKSYELMMPVNRNITFRSYFRWCASGFLIAVSDWAFRKGGFTFLTLVLSAELWACRDGGRE